MLVTATKKGFYGKLRKEGDEFEIKNKKALGTWMKLVKVKKVKEEPEADTDSNEAEV